MCRRRRSLRTECSIKSGSIAQTIKFRLENKIWIRWTLSKNDDDDDGDDDDDVIFLVRPAAFSWSGISRGISS